MPKTKSQKILFSIMMSFMMVYGMEVYNGALIHKGLTNALFLLHVGELLLLMLSVVVLETLIGGPLARRLAFGFVDTKKDRPIAVVLVVQIMTVSIMYPMMSLVATIIFKGEFSIQIFAKWVQTLAINFPMTFCWQIFIAGPLVRLIVGRFAVVTKGKF